MPSLAEPGSPRRAPGRREPASKELQLEARHLTFLVFVVVVLCVASFLLGRWVERQSMGPSPGSYAADAEPGTIEEEGDVAEELTFFDTLKNDQPVLLETEEATGGSMKPVASSGGARRPEPAGRRSVGEGIMVQVLASKQRAPADELRQRLRRKGYTALLVVEEGTYKVRVGPYADREEAERAADVLRDQENLTTWIP